MSDFLPVVNSVLAVFAIIALGASARTLGWLRRESDQSFAALIAYLLMPCLFFDRILGGPEMGSLATVWIPPLIGFSITALGFGLGLVIARVWGSALGLDSPEQQSAFALCVGVCNYGYIPLPLAEKFYPSAVVELIIHNVGVDLALWSVGIAVVVGGAGFKRVWINPPLFAVSASLFLREVVGKDNLPETFTTVTKMLGDCAIPLGLVLSGAIMVDFFRQAKWAGSARIVIAAMGIRQLLIPTAMLMFAMHLLQGENMRTVIMLQAAMPSAIFPIVLVRLFDKDVDTAMRVVLSTSLAGILLIPIWLGIGKWMLGL